MKIFKTILSYIIGIPLLWLLFALLGVIAQLVTAIPHIILPICLVIYLVYRLIQRIKAPLKK